MHFIFDTAATDSVVPESLFSPTTNETKSFSWISDGVALNSIGTIVLDLDFGQKNTLSWQFCVLPKITTCLIGMDFMDFYNVTLLTQTRQVIFGGDGTWSGTDSESDSSQPRIENQHRHRRRQSRRSSRRRRVAWTTEIDRRDTQKKLAGVFSTSEEDSEHEHSFKLRRPEGQESEN